MKWNKFFFLIFLTAIIACEEDIDMGLNQPIPVIYCVVNKQDSVHQVVLSKSIVTNDFNEIKKMAKIFDSLFYEEAKVYFEYNYRNITRRIYLEKKLFYDKEPGAFSYPDHIVYQSKEKIPRVKQIGLYIEIPGQALTYSIVEMNTSIKITSPYMSGMTIAIDTIASWKIESEDWNGYREADFEIDIIERNRAGNMAIKKVKFNKARFSGSFEPEYIEISTDLLINEICSDIKRDPNVIWRKFGEIRLEFYKGDKYYEQYIQSYESFNDYMISPIYSNITNGLGLFSYRSYDRRDKLFIKSYSIRGLIEDPRLRNLRFIR
ncbi:hypothetical protein ACFLSI_00585 [Bacteroidota bacterium]